MIKCEGLYPKISYISYGSWCRVKRSYVTNLERLVSTVTRHTSNKLGSVMTQSERFPFTKSYAPLIMWSREKTTKLFTLLHKAYMHHIWHSGEIVCGSSTNIVQWPLMNWSYDIIWQIRNVLSLSPGGPLTNKRNRPVTKGDGLSPTKTSNPFPAGQVRSCLVMANKFSVVEV